MSVRYNENDYLYGSARLRALERNIAGNERCARFCELSPAEFYREAGELLGASGDAAQGLESAQNFEGVLTETLRGAFSLTASLLPESGVGALDIYRYPYDCHNIKYAIKCEVKGRDPLPGMSLCGTVSPESIAGTLVKNDYSALPPHMAEAARTARERQAQNRDPQEIDFLLDAACFADMSEAAGRVPEVPILRRLTALRADTLNILTCVRLVRMTGDAGRRVSTLARAYLPGGRVGADALTAALRGEHPLHTLTEDVCPSAGIYGLGERLRDAAEQSLGAAEKLLEDFITGELSAVKYRAAGLEVFAAYLSSVETSVKNLRIIAAGKHAGTPPQRIRERLRICLI